MKKYIFLDNWVLSDFTRTDKRDMLSDYIQDNGLSILINRATVAELYNPGWQHSKVNDRGARVAEFIAQHPSAIIHPDRVFQSEIDNYPSQLTNLPIDFDLNILPSNHKAPVLLMILRRDESLLKEGIDVTKWVDEIQVFKTSWLSDVENIIDKACKKGVLTRDGKGRFINLEGEKENFLRFLDRRYFTPEMITTMDIRKNFKLMFEGATANLPAVRLSSLFFWFAYVDIDKHQLLARKPSDIVDFYQMSLIPYCSVFTVDTSMLRLINRIKAHISYPCEILDQHELEHKLKLSSG